MFDGRVIVDRIMQTIIISAMDRLRVYSITEKEGKIKPAFVNSLMYKHQADCSPLARDSLNAINEICEDRKFEIECYTSTDKRCLYTWIIKQ
jgi:hypothetical protein